jgi:RNA polymerase primary sigma factor
MKKSIPKTPEMFKKYILQKRYIQMFDQEMKVIDTIFESFDVDEPSIEALHNLDTKGQGFVTNYEKEFFNRIKHTQLLTDHEVIEFTFKIKGGHIAEQMKKEYSNDVSKHVILNQIIHNGLEARNKLVEGNLRLVLWVANKYKNHGLEMMDLFQEGTLGLMKAAEHFDYEKGVRFSTYATWWITQSITRALSNQSRLIRLPEHLIDTLRKLHKTQNKLHKDLHRPPTDDEMAFEMSMPIEKIWHLKEIQKTPISLDFALDNKETIKDLIPSTDMNPETNESYETMITNIEYMLDKLSNLERKTIEYRYGFHDGKKHSYEKIGLLLGVDRHDVSKIEKNALDKLKSSYKQTN